VLRAEPAGRPGCNRRHGPGVRGMYPPPGRAGCEAACQGQAPRADTPRAARSLPGQRVESPVGSGASPFGSGRGAGGHGLGAAQPGAARRTPGRGGRRERQPSVRGHGGRTRPGGHQMGAGGRKRYTARLVTPARTAAGSRPTGSPSRCTTPPGARPRHPGHGPRGRAVAQHPRHGDQPRTPLVPVLAPLRVTPPVRTLDPMGTIRTHVRVVDAPSGAPRRPCQPSFCRCFIT
jgi:hypothetical protein